MTDQQPLNAREIIDRVRRHAAGHPGGTADPSSAAQAAETDASGVRAPFFQGGFLDVERNSFDLREFLQFHDRTFVTYGYQALLKRDPDPEGFDHHLERLRSGRADKTRILASFRFSAEGRKRQVKVRGLWWGVFKLLLKKPPLVGGVLDYFFALFGLRRISADLARKEIELGRLFEETGLALARLESRIESRLEAKADKSRLEQKADREEMGQYLRSVNHVLDMVTALHDPTHTGGADPEGPAQPGVDAYSARWTDDLYLTFEDAFRGPRESIMARLSVYVPDVRGALEQAAPAVSTQAAAPDSRVLDLGCGRGEFLELLSRHGIQVVGIDSNRAMVSHCRDRGLDVREQDIFECLGALPPECLAAVTAFQVLEHLPFPLQLRLIDQCRRVLSPGGLLVLETPNPENIMAGAIDFHRDPTHLKPMHPDTLLLLARARGFFRAQIRYPSQAEGGGMRFEDAENMHFTDFKDHLTVARDYALLAYKGRE